MKCYFLVQCIKMCIVFALCAGFIQESCSVSMDEGHCLRGDSECPQRDSGNYEQSKIKELEVEKEKTGTDDGDEESLPSAFLHRGMQGLEEVMDQVANSKVKVMEGIDTMMDKVSESKDKMIESLDSMMDRVSESKDKMMERLDSVMHTVSESKEKVMDKVREGIDTMAHSKVMEEIDHVIEKMAHSKVLEEIRALPGELRESILISVRNQSYLMAGLMVAISATILFSGAVYYAWCHHDAWSYHIGTVAEAKALLKKAKESAEKCVSSANSVSGGDFASELCNMSTRGCQGEAPENNFGLKDVKNEELEPLLDSAKEEDTASICTPSSKVANGHVVAEDVTNKGFDEQSDFDLPSSSDCDLKNLGNSKMETEGQNDSTVCDHQLVETSQNGQIAGHDLCEEDIISTSGHKQLVDDQSAKCISSGEKDIVKNEFFIPGSAENVVENVSNGDLSQEKNICAI